MSIEAIAAESVAPKVIELAPPMPQQVGLEATARFESALSQAATRVEDTGDVPPAVKGLLDTLDKVNIEAKSVADYAKAAETSGGQLTPGEVVQLTMRCQEFMFHCQLTSNIANRSSDGIQQLFKQQG